jgi:hypothetical protein
MSSLPTPIVERFEFVTTVTGPGVHLSLVYAMLCQLTKGLMMGSFVKNTINEIYSVFFSIDHCSQTDSLKDAVKSRLWLSTLECTMT